MEIKLHIHHGGAFVREPELVYLEGDLKDIFVDPDELCLHEIQADIMKLGYVEHGIRKVYYRRSHIYFEEALVSIEDGGDVHELIILCQRTTY